MASVNSNTPPRRFVMSELFLFKRQPKWNITDRWNKPADDVFDNQIQDADFLIESELVEEKLKNKALSQSLVDLKDFLLSHFFECDQKAKHFQNLYFRNQWILIFGSSFTAIVAAISIFLNTSGGMVINTTVTTVVSVPGIEQTAEPSTSESTSASDESLASTQTGTKSSLGSLVTAGVAFVIGIFTALNQRGQPQAQWYLYRKLAEELRHHYFLYLMHLPPYDRIDRLEVLEANAVEIKQNRKGVESTDVAKYPPAPLQLDDSSLKKLIDLYRSKRVYKQFDYYKRAIDEYARNADFVYRSSIVIAAVPPLLSAISVALNSPLSIALTLALLPVFGALLASFEKIYGWNRQVSLYSDARDSLERNLVSLPAREKRPDEKYGDILNAFVSDVENTLKNERNQWGQLNSEGSSNTKS